MRIVHRGGHIFARKWLTWYVWDKHQFVRIPFVSRAVTLSKFSLKGSYEDLKQKVKKVKI